MAHSALEPHERVEFIYEGAMMWRWEKAGVKNRQSAHIGPGRGLYVHVQRHAKAKKGVCMGWKRV